VEGSELHIRQLLSSEVYCSVARILQNPVLWPSRLEVSAQIIQQSSAVGWQDKKGHKTIALFTLALKPVSNRFTFKPVWPNHIHYVVYRKQFPKRIRGVYTAALNRCETALKLI